MLRTLLAAGMVISVIGVGVEPASAGHRELPAPATLPARNFSAPVPMPRVRPHGPPPVPMPMVRPQGPPPVPMPRVAPSNPSPVLRFGG